MDRKLTYTFSLIGFFLMWGVFGLVAATPRAESAGLATPPPVESTLVVPGATPNTGMIPVTGKPQPTPGVFVIYGLFGVGALILVLALLNAANKSTSAYARHKDPPEKPLK